MPIIHHALGARIENSERIFRAIASPALGTSACSAHENVVVPGAVVPLHRHAYEEVIVCLQGRAECAFGDGAFQPYETGSVVIIPANTLHTLRNVGTTELRQLSFFAGPEPGTTWVDSAGSVSV